MCKKLLILSGYDQKKSPDFEKDAKSIYLQQTADKPALTFMHKVPPHLVVQKTKEKKPVAIVFDDSIPTDQIIAIKKAVTKSRNGDSPRFVYVSKTVVITGMETADNHLSARNLVLN